MSSITLISDQIQKARRRLDFNPVTYAAEIRDKTPRQLSTQSQQLNRRRWLDESIGDQSVAKGVFERVLDGNELMPVNYLARGIQAAKAVCLLQVIDGFGSPRMKGTGFLIAPGVLLTNNHVLPQADYARLSEAHFGFELGMDGAELAPVIFRLDPARLFFTSEPLDFTVVAVQAGAANGGGALADFGLLPLTSRHGKVLDGEWLSIIQHPEGRRKMICVRENRLLRRTPDVLWYSTDTLAGSSGSPVLNNDWQVVALHHSGIPAERDGRMQTVDGRDFVPHQDAEDRIRWLANEGIRASRIVETLAAAQPDHPLLLPLFADQVLPSSVPVSTPPQGPLSGLPRSFPVNLNPKPQTGMTTQTITIPLQINLQVRGNATDGAAVVAAEGAAVTRAEKYNPTPEEEEILSQIDYRVDPDYGSRKGFQTDFLAAGAAMKVNLPKLSTALEATVASPVVKDGTEGYVLHYHNLSVVMSEKRRFPLYVAANLNAAERYLFLSGREDKWVRDPRLAQGVQVENWYYSRNQNKFDRGHLARREDVEWGKTPQDAIYAASDSLHWTNCSPQHAEFNRIGKIWQNLELHILERAIVRNQFRAQVFTGPVLDEGDPEYADIQYPEAFWKVVVAINASGKLFATAYILSQADIIQRFGIEAAPEVPFGPYLTAQRKISEIEQMTGLRFTYGANKSLSDCDPLEGRPTRRSVRPLRRYESLVLD